MSADQTTPSSSRSSVQNQSDLPKRIRLAAGTRLLNPFTGTYYRHGGKFIHPERWTVDGKVVIWMSTGNRLGIWARTYYIVDASVLGLKQPQVHTEQLRLFQ